MTNELSTGNHGNALTITEQFPEGKYNLLVPIKTVAEIAELHKPVMNVVYISTNEADKEVYLQEKPDGWALTKKALTKLMKAAGIRIVKSVPMLPTKCEKCAAVNRGIGRPVNCGSCPNKDVKHQVTISMPQLTGENVEVVASKEILYDDVTSRMSQAQKGEFSKFRSEMCETKALNRALRIAMQIKATYSKTELAKPFVVAYLVPNLDNEAVRNEAVRSFFGAAKELYGSTESAEKAQHIIDADRELEQENDTGYEPPAQPEYIPEAVQQQNFIEETAPDYDPTICSECGAKCSNAVVKYSQEQFGRTLCMPCQRKTQGH